MTNVDWPPREMTRGPASPIEVTDDERALFDRLLAPSKYGPVAPPTAIDLGAAAPAWKFLCYATDHAGLLAHGSNSCDIAMLEPRFQTDAMGRPSQRVFATPDGIWPIFFAIVDYSRYRGSLRNWFTRTPDGDGTLRRRYAFSVSAEMLAMEPWTAGSVYLLPRDTFTPTLDMLGNPTEEWSSAQPVKPVARVEVKPADFPYLDAVATHDDAEAARLADLQTILLGAIQNIATEPNGATFTFASDPQLHGQLAELCERLDATGVLGSSTYSIHDDGTHITVVLQGPEAEAFAHAVAQVRAQTR